NIFFAELARGIEDIATMYKYNIILSNSDSNKEKELQLINTMLEKQVDGIVFMGGNISEEHIQQFKTASVPVVLAATFDPTEEIPSVNIDYELAAYEATQELITNSTGQPALIADSNDNMINNLKYEGYMRALKETNIKVNEDYIIKGENSYNGGLYAVDKLLKLDKLPSSVFVTYDEI